MTDRVVHFEIPFDDGDRARAFYRDAFGWDVREMPELDYTFVTTGPVTEQGESSEPGYVNGGMVGRSAAVPQPVLTLGVADIDASLDRAVSLGATVVTGKRAVGEMGFTAYLTDTEGNVVGLWQDAPRDGG